MIRLEDVKNYFEYELDDVIRTIVKGYNEIPKDKLIDGSIDRCLGVATFAQMMGLEYADIEPLYENARVRLEGMREVRTT